VGVYLIDMSNTYMGVGKSCVGGIGTSQSERLQLMGMDVIYFGTENLEDL